VTGDATPPAGSPDPLVAGDPDPTELTLEDLRRRREQLQREDDEVSYARRVAQARLDLVDRERARRENPGETGLHDDLSSVLARHLTGDLARPPRPTDDLSDSAVALELDATCATNGFSRLDELDLAGLDALRGALEEFERRISSDRRARFERIDALTAELVRRYRDGEADVDALLAD
jgi:hypothetical protein